MEWATQHMMFYTVITNSKAECRWFEKELKKNTYQKSYLLNNNPTNHKPAKFNDHFHPSST